MYKYIHAIKIFGQRGDVQTALICVVLGAAVFFFSASIMGRAVPQKPETQKAVVEPQSYIEALSEKDHYKSRTDSPYTVIEYVDLDCPYCQKLYLAQRQVYAATFLEKINHVYRLFPLTELHPFAAKKILLAECVAENRGEDIFFQFIDAYFLTKRVGAPMEDFTPLVAKYINAEQIASCQNDAVLKGRITDSVASAVRTGVYSTPSMALLKDGVLVERFDLIGSSRGMDILYNTLRYSLGGAR